MAWAPGPGSVAGLDADPGSCGYFAGGACSSGMRKSWRYLTEACSGRRQPQIGERGDLYRGLSVQYLQDRLLSDLQASSDDTVYDVEPRIRQFGAGTVCPRDGRPGAAYVDVAEDRNAGRAGFMLSYYWGYKVAELVRATASFCQTADLETSTTRFWICAFCVNQFRVKEMQHRGEKVPFDTFRRTFFDRVVRIKNVVAMLTPWDDPANLKRLWCVFELHVALHTPGCTLHVLIPDNQLANLRDFVCSTFSSSGSTLAHMTEVWSKFGQVKMHEADATYEEDRLNILRVIAPGVSPGDPDALHRACYLQNMKITQRMAASLAHCVQKHMREMFDSGKVFPLRGFMAAGRVLCLMGQHEKGLQILEKGIAITPEDERHGHDYAEMLLGVAVCRSCTGELEEALAVMDEARAIFKSVGPTASYVVCLLCTGTIYDVGLGRHQEGMAFFLEAQQVVEATASCNSLEAALALARLAHCFEHRGEDDKAADFYEKANAAFEMAGYTGTHWYFEHLAVMADFIKRRRSAEQAAAMEWQAKVGLAGRPTLTSQMHTIRELARRAGGVSSWDLAQLGGETPWTWDGRSRASFMMESH